MGGYERHSAPWALDEHSLDAIPPDFNGRLLEEDWPRFEEIAANSRRRVPAMEEIKVTRLINGPEAFTPDNEFCLGESEVRGFFVAAGFCAHGLAGAGGIGKVMAEWILDGEPVARRLGDGHPPLRRRTTARPATRSSARKEVYETYYDIRYPGHERQAGPAAAHLERLRLAPPSTAPRSARSPAGSASTGTSRNAAAGDESLRPRGWAGMHWSPAIGAEHRATRERAGLFDESSFAKLEVAGPGRRGAARAPVRQPRRARGRRDHLHADAQPPRRDRVRLHRHARARRSCSQIVTGTAFGNHDLSWIRRHAARRRSVVRCADVTARWACFALWGPRAREILAPLTPDPLDFGYMRMRELAVGDVPVRALRVTFVGELGWELYCPTEYGAGLWRTLWEAGAAARAGRRRLPRDRLAAAREGLPGVGAPTSRPTRRRCEAGLGFCVREDRTLHRRRTAPGGEPRAAAALPGARGPALGGARQRAGAGRRRDRRARDERRLRLHGRALDRLRVPAGRRLESGPPVEVDIFGAWVAGEVAREPLFDPTGERVRAPIRG